MLEGGKVVVGMVLSVVLVGRRKESAIVSHRIRLQMLLECKYVYQCMPLSSNS